MIYKRKPQVHRYGYADEDKANCHTQQGLHNATVALRNWLEENQSSINISRAKFMNNKSNMKAELHTNPVQVMKS